GGSGGGERGEYISLPSGDLRAAEHMRGPDRHHDFEALRPTTVPRCVPQSFCDHVVPPITGMAILLCTDQRELPDRVWLRLIIECRKHIRDPHKVAPRRSFHNSVECVREFEKPRVDQEGHVVARERDDLGIGAAARSVPSMRSRFVSISLKK